VDLTGFEQDGAHAIVREGAVEAEAVAAALGTVTP
jgi:hypothetical protein